MAQETSTTSLGPYASGGRKGVGGGIVVASSFPSRCIQFPPREQLLTAVDRGADVAVVAAVVVV